MVVYSLGGFNNKLDKHVLGSSFKKKYFSLNFWLQPHLTQFHLSIFLELQPWYIHTHHRTPYAMICHYVYLTIQSRLSIYILFTQGEFAFSIDQPSVVSDLYKGNRPDLPHTGWGPLWGQRKSSGTGPASLPHLNRTGSNRRKMHNITKT